MKYSKYTLEDFLSDEQFIQWVLNPSRNSDLFLENLIRSNPDQVNNIQKAREILLSTNFTVPEPDPHEKQEVLLKIINGYTSESKYKIEDKKRKNNWYSKIAASFLILFSFGYFVWQYIDKNEEPENNSFEVKYITKQNPSGQKSKFILPDGSHVHLNAESSLRFPEKFSRHNRTVFLSGEAFFDIKENESHPFVVNTSIFQARVLGTSFNVNNDAVALLTGKVSVTKPGEDNNEIILVPGQKAVHDKESKSIYKSTFNYQEEIAWKDGLLYFKDADFFQVKEKLEKWYGVEIELPANLNLTWSYTGSFENESLEEVLERIAYLENFDYKIAEKKVYIYE